MKLPANLSGLLAVLLAAAMVFAPAVVSAPLDQSEERVHRLLAAGDYLKAREVAEDAVNRAQIRWGTVHPSYALAIATLADIQVRLHDDFAQAERHYRYSLETSEAAFGSNDPRIGRLLSGLAQLYLAEQRSAEADALLRQALQIFERSGQHELEIARILQKIGGIANEEGRLKEARALFERSLETIGSMSGGDRPDAAESWAGLAHAHYVERRYDEAARLLERGLAIREKALGPLHPDVGWSLNMLGAVRFTQGLYEKAEPLWKRALEIRVRSLGSDHGHVVTQHNNLGALFSSKGALAKSLHHYRAAATILARRERSLREGSRWKTEIDWSARLTLGNLVSVAWRLADQQPANHERLAAETFELAQWLDMSRSSRALAQMSARLPTNAQVPSRWVRDSQSLVRTRLDLETKLTRALTADRRNEETIGRLRAALRKIDGIQDSYDRLKERLETNFDGPVGDVMKRFSRQFDRSRGLAAPEPVDLGNVQRVLAADEALVRYLVLEDQSFVWVATKEHLRWRRIPIGREELALNIGRLRRSLDQPGSGRGAVPLSPPAGGSFDLALAHSLYLDLWAPIEKAVQGKGQVLVAPSGPLTGMPFQVLVTEAPGDALGATATETYRKAEWLIRDHALSTLPFAGALTLLRSMPEGAQAPKAFFGMGDPLFGPCPMDRPQAAEPQIATNVPLPNEMYRGLNPDVGKLCGLAQLPEARDELVMAAASTGAGKYELLMGADASEAALKARSEDGSLASYRVLHFATHGIVAGEIEGYAEPGLALAVPTQPTRADDGYLAASEIADLKLHAEWVILSACNTAAGERPGAEALSGLASSFIYAGAKALLVSHWAVHSDAAVELTTRTLKAVGDGRGLRRSEALRRAMLSMIDEGTYADANPARWAPFSLIGDGR